MTDSTGAAEGQLGPAEPAAEEQRRCQAVTKSGRPCTLYAEPGSDYCPIHQPAPAASRSEGLSPSGPRSEDSSPSRSRLRARLHQAGAVAGSAIPSAGLDRLQGLVKKEWLDPETWKGTWYMLNYLAKYEADLVKRRFTGEYETDEWGLDWEFVDAMRPLLNLAYTRYWRVEATGVDHIPTEGPVLLVANHSGRQPWDSLMVTTAVLREHAAGRLVRTLHAAWIPTVPFLSHMSVKLGQALATVDNGIRLLEADELVAVYPEAADARPYLERYRLGPFDTVDFVTMALTTGALIVPVAVVGAADAQVRRPAAGISLTGFSLRARLRAAYGLAPRSDAAAGEEDWRFLELLSLPIQWTIDFGEPLPTEPYGPDAVGDAALTSQVADQVRNRVQGMISDRLAQRRAARLLA